MAFSMSWSSFGGVTYWAPHAFEDIAEDGKLAIGRRAGGFGGQCCRVDDAHGSGTHECTDEKNERSPTNHCVPFQKFFADHHGRESTGFPFFRNSM